MLTTQELTTLLNVLDEVAVPFQEIAEAVFRGFSAGEHFRVASSLFMLTQNRVLALTARLNAYFCLWSLYKSDSQESLPSNPFFPAFWKPMQSMGPALNPHERAFLYFILNNTISSVSDSPSAPWKVEDPDVTLKVAGLSALEFLNKRPEDLVTPNVDLLMRIRTGCPP
jgi:hypothetical protein